MSLNNCCFCLESCEIVDLDAWADDIMSSTEVHSSQMHTQTNITSMLSKEGKLFTITINRPPTLIMSWNEQLNRKKTRGKNIYCLLARVTMKLYPCKTIVHLGLTTFNNYFSGWQLLMLSMLEWCIYVIPDTFI